MNSAKLCQIMVGLLLSLLLLVSCTPSQPEGKTIIVTSLADSGPNTLRQALLTAQSGDKITFDPAVFQARMPTTIALISTLPPITQGHLTIDASKIGVILDGTNIQGIPANGLTITSDGNTIRGLQVIHFLNAGILLDNNARNNTITGNLIGTDTSGKKHLGNQFVGIAILGGASYNTIGPDNLIAFNLNGGIYVSGANSLYNSITRNNIYDNDGPGIDLLDGGNMNLLHPYWLEFDPSTGTMSGWADTKGTVEIYSDAVDEGKFYEGQTTTDDKGNFTFNKGSSFAGRLLTATVTDTDGNTSRFSTPILTTSDTRNYVGLQEGNNSTKTRLISESSKELEYNRIGAIASDMLTMPGGNASQFLDELISHGIKRFKWSVNEVDATLNPDGTIPQINWNESEFDIPTVPGGTDDFATGLVNNGIISTYVLTFWDKANHPNGWQTEPGYSRFKTEEEVQRYLDYVRFIVDHFKGRVQYYELWNENGGGAPIHYIAVDDYINLARRTIPVIRQEDPETKIVVGSIVLQNPEDRDYLFKILESDIIPLVDVVSWHPMFSVSPEHESEYYYNYPSIVQEIKDVAFAHGFNGEYRAEELDWASPDAVWEPTQHSYSNTIAAKYYARGIVMNLGMDVSTGVAGLSTIRPDMSCVIRNLCNLMAGAKPTSISMNIQSNMTNIRNYNFSLSDGSQLVALWTDGIAVDDDPGVNSTVTIQNVSVQKVMGIDVLNSFEQPLDINVEGSNLVINGLLIKDYPIFIHLVP
jgi:hypothetical protein